MKKNRELTKQEIRRQAEAKWAEQKRQTGPFPLSEVDVRRLLHELEVHQIELELQNEELMQARAELEAGLSQYVELYDFAPVGYFTSTRNGTIRQVNLVGASLLGMPRGILLNQPLENFVPIEFHPILYDFLDEVFSAQGRKAACELRIRNDKVHPRWVHMEGVCSEDGLECKAALVDIDERKQAEEALHKSEQTFSVIFKKAPFAAGLTSLNGGKYIEVNDEFERVFGFTREEIIGKTSLELGMYPDPEQRARSAELFRKQGFVHNLDMRLQTKTGELHDVLVNSDPVEIRGETYILTTANDITERKRSQEELRESELRYRTLITHSPIGIYETDANGSCLFVNPRWSQIGGLSLEEALRDGWVSAIYENDRERVSSEWDRTAALGEPFDMEYRFRTPKGVVTWVHGLASAVRNEQGEISGYFGTISDITERKQAEDELRLSRDRLAELSRRLVEVHESESRAIARELHDQIGQMLTALKLTLEIAPQLPTEQATKKFVQAQELLDDLMSRVSRLSLELRPAMLDDLGVLPALLWHINRYREQTGIEVEFKHNGLEGKRLGSEIETTVYRIVQESLTNVARHAGATRVRLEVQREAGAIEIQIEDNGVGFDAQRALAQNRGLGAMRERVHLLGRSFQIESQPGKGAKKFIRLPLREISA